MQNSQNKVPQTAQTVGQPDGSFTRRMGNTTFIIGLHYKKDGKETMEDKVKKLIRDDVKAGNF